MCYLNRDLNRAKQIFDEGDYTCVFCKGNRTVKSRDTGIRPLVQYLESEASYVGFAAVDKIVGKAAALLYVLLGVTAVYATVMSMEGVKVLVANGIEIYHDTLTDCIINRKGNGLCPMEQTVGEIDDPFEAFLAIRKTLDRLSEKIN